MGFELTIDNINKIKKKRMNEGYVILFYSNHCGHCIHFLPVWKQLKINYSKEYNFIDLEQKQMQQLKEEHNIIFSKVAYFPYICVYSPKEKKHIEYNDRARDEKSLIRFIRNKIMPTELTFDNINDIIKECNKYVLLLYWKSCPYCIEFLPMWNELKEKLKDNFQFFQLEFDELKKIKENNNNPSLSFLRNFASTFPTIIFKNNDYENKFEGRRTIENLTKFIIDSNKENKENKKIKKIK